MSKDPTTPLGAAELYLHTLTAYAAPGALLDVRYRTRDQSVAQIFLGAHAPAHAANTIARIGERVDVYVGCAPRLRRRGTRADLAPTALLWADCDEPAAVAALLAFEPPASMIVSSGGGAHGYWTLTRALDVDELEQANRRLAAGLGADPRCADGTRVLRPAGTTNNKYDPPRPVQLRSYNNARYRPVEIFSALPPEPLSPTARHRRRSNDSRLGDDPLQSIPPAHYVTVLTGRAPGHDRKIHCPLHPDHTPSFHVYPTAEQGWTCFGCTAPDGRPLGGDIYTLASRLWAIPARGRDFFALRDRLDQLFAVQRD